MTGVPFSSSSPAGEDSARHDWPAGGGAPGRAGDPGRVERGTARLLRDLAAFGESATIRRESAAARLDALQPWLASLAYALVQEPHLDRLCRES